MIYFCKYKIYLKLHFEKVLIKPRCQVELSPLGLEATLLAVAEDEVLLEEGEVAVLVKLTQEMEPASRVEEVPGQEADHQEGQEDAARQSRPWQDSTGAGKAEARN